MTAAQYDLSSRRIRRLSWACTLSPFALPVSFMLLGVAARAELGAWLQYGGRGAESPGFVLCFDVVGGLSLAVIALALPVWIVCVAAGWRRANMQQMAVIQAFAYPAIWVVAFFLAASEPTGFGTWYLD